MNWESILDSIASRFPKALSYMDKLKGAFEGGEAVFDDIQGLAKWLQSNFDDIKTVAPDRLRSILEAIQNGNIEQEYRIITEGLSIQELLTIQAGANNLLDQVNAKKQAELKMLRTLMELPQKVLALARLVI